ncbi:hypothetical protein ABKV19_027667 [Rosa sericea]
MGIDVDREGYFNLCNMLPGTIQFPTTQQMARQGILADAMTLGKIVMTTALILARPRRVSSSDINITKKRKIVSDTSLAFKPKRGTLIVSPWSSLSQWKDELKTHSESESISIIVYNDPGGISSYAILKEDVVLTEYDVLAYDFDLHGENSVFHQVNWYRAILDEVPALKDPLDKLGAQPAYTLSSHCRWAMVVNRNPSTGQRGLTWKTFTASYTSCTLNHGVVDLDLSAASNVFLMGTVEERMQQAQARSKPMNAGVKIRSARIEEFKMLFT